MMATEGTSGVQGYPLWDKDEEKSNVHKMEKEIESGGMEECPTTDEDPENPKSLVRRETYRGKADKFRNKSWA